MTTARKRTFAVVVSDDGGPDKRVRQVMEVKVYDSEGRETGRSIELDASIFAVEPNDHAIWLDVRRIQAAARQGTHKAKERGEVTGSTRKLYRQKGTGYARAGSAKSPIRRSGGTTFGPRPRDYAFKVNKKTSRLACRSALTYKARNEGFRIVDDLSFEGTSTRALVGLVAALDLQGAKVLFLTNEHRPTLYQSSRNLAKVRVKEARQLSTLDVLGADVLVFEEGVLEALGERLGASKVVAES